MTASAMVTAVASSKGGIHPSVLAKCMRPLPAVLNDQAIVIVGSPSGAIGYTNAADDPAGVITVLRPNISRYQSREEAR